MPAPETPRASILHVDLDAFYVSMEFLRHPELRGTPVIVGGLGDRGVVTTCSYEARRYGVHSAMPMARARRLCPGATYLPSDFAYYAPASKRFHEILAEYTPAHEPAGADEAYLDVAGSRLLFGEPADIAARIRQRIQEELGIAASVGVAANKLVAKVASDAAKPDGLLVVEPGEEAAFLAPRPIRDLPMIGPRTAESLAGLGIHTIGQLAALPLETLRSRFGSHGVELHHRAHGRHEGEVLHERARARSMSRESTFQHDIADPDRLRGILRSHAERVAASLAAESLGARTVTLKLRFPPFETITRSRTPGETITLADELYRLGVAMFEDAWAKHGSRPVRLLGLGATGLVEAGHQLRFGEDGRDIRLAGTLSELRQRFGDDAVRHGNELRD